MQGVERERKSVAAVARGGKRATRSRGSLLVALLLETGATLSALFARAPHALSVILMGFVMLAVLSFSRKARLMHTVFLPALTTYAPARHSSVEI